VKKAGKDRQCSADNQIDPHTKEGIPMTNTTFQKGDHTMKHVIFIILGAVTVMCLALATGYLQP